MGRLPNAPLQEVIFEVRWNLDVQDGTNLLYDPKFEVGLGELRHLVKKRFPEVKRKFHEQIPVQLLPHTASWQFRPSPGGWPLIQLGHGVLTVNDTDTDYDWKKVFFPLIKDALHWLEQAYEGAPTFSYAELRYIDSVRTREHAFKGWDSFVSGNLNVSVNNQFKAPGRVLDVGLHQVFELERDGQLLVAVNSGKREKDDAMIWQTAVQQPGPFDKASLLDWADGAHRMSHDLFEQLCKPEFHERFTRPRG